jgi:IclR family KDG regulon transcriptional repressor
MQPEGTRTTVLAVERALDILLCFTQSQAELSLSTIAKRVGLHKSTTHRLLASLQSKGFVRRVESTDKYVLGWILLELVSGVYHHGDLAVFALPEMTRLRDITGETVSLSIKSGAERLRIQAVESKEPIRSVVSIGKSYPLHFGASGKVLLAFSPVGEWEEVFRSIKLTGEEAETLRHQLHTIRTEGFGISSQERDVDAASIAVPVFDGDDDCVASLSISGPVSRFTKDKMKEHIETLRASAHWMSRRLSQDTANPRQMNPKEVE